jgi:hypothetical protein
VQGKVKQLAISLMSPVSDVAAFQAAVAAAAETVIAKAAVGIVQAPVIGQFRHELLCAAGLGHTALLVLAVRPLRQDKQLFEALGEQAEDRASSTQGATAMSLPELECFTSIEHPTLVVVIPAHATQLSHITLDSFAAVLMPGTGMKFSSEAQSKFCSAESLEAAASLANEYRLDHNPSECGMGEECVGV